MREGAARTRNARAPEREHVQLGDLRLGRGGAQRACLRGRHVAVRRERMRPQRARPLGRRGAEVDPHAAIAIHSDWEDSLHFLDNVLHSALVQARVDARSGREVNPSLVCRAYDDVPPAELFYVTRFE